MDQWQLLRKLLVKGKDEKGVLANHTKKTKTKFEKLRLHVAEAWRLIKSH